MREREEERKTKKKKKRRSGVMSWKLDNALTYEYGTHGYMLCIQFKKKIAVIFGEIGLNTANPDCDK